MANSFSVIDLVTREALRIAHEKLSMIGTVDRQYDKTFAYDSSRGPIGQTLRVREPNRYTRRQGSRVMDVQDQSESTQTITVATQDGVDMRFNSAELVQSVSSDGAFNNFSSKYIAPAVATMVSGIEADAIAYWTKKVNNVVGTYGTPPTDLTSVTLARASLNQNLAPMADRYIQCDSITMGGMVNGLKGLFQDSEQIKQQYREGMIGRTAGADWYENERVWTMDNTGDVAGTLDTYTVVNGDTDLTVTGFSAAPAAGMTFTIAGVYPCHPETKARLPGSSLMRFTVTSATTTVINFSPAIYLSGAKQNVCDSAGAVVAPSTTAAVAFGGNASTSYVQNLMYHKEAFQFITADLPIMADSDKCVRREQDGLSIRVWQGSDIRNDELLVRMDILYGMAALRPEWACRMTN